MLTAADLADIPLLSCLEPLELERLARTSADLRLQLGEYATHEGETRALYIVIEGCCEITKTIEGIERVIGTRGPNEEVGIVFGETAMALGMLQPANLRAAEPSRVVCIGPREFHIATAASPELAERLGAAARLRIEGLAEVTAEAEPLLVTIVGPHLDALGHELRRFLDSNAISFEWIEPDEPHLSTAWPDWRSAGEDFPILRFENGAVAVRPTMREVADRIGLSTRPQYEAYDTVVIGGGPAGLAAAVYGASEGLRTIMIEREAPGGQAGTSSRIENYLGFPNGVSGDEHATRALQQAKSMSHYLIEQLSRKANIEIKLQCEVAGVHGADHLAQIELVDKTTGTTDISTCMALFVFIGADAETEWLPPEIARDARGYILTGEQMTKAVAWPLERDPYLLETSVPGIFACGDVRFNSVKRVASGVGEGSMSIAFVHQYLAQKAAAGA